MSVATTIGSLALVGVVAAGAVSILKSCALDIGILRDAGWCEGEAVLATRARIAVLAEERAGLGRRVFELEREVAALQCTALPPDPTAPLDPVGWERRDLAMLNGCWALASTYRTRNVDTGEIVSYPEWRMCFDTKGQGTQTMRGSDGSTCEGPVRAEFTNAGLALVEPGDLPCSDGGAIHQRQILCVPAPEGRASCDTLQPETGGAATVGFARAEPPQ